MFSAKGPIGGNQSLVSGGEILSLSDAVIIGGDKSNTMEVFTDGRRFCAKPIKVPSAAKGSSAPLFGAFAGYAVNATAMWRQEQHEGVIYQNKSCPKTTTSSIML